MNLRTTSFALVSAAALAIGSAAFAADPPAQPGEPQQPQQPQGNQADPQQQINQLLVQIAADPKTAADKLFVLTAALHNQSEIALAKEALQKSQNDQVKKMAKHMIDSLQKTHEKIQQTAQAIGLPLPQELAQAAVHEVSIVAALPADQFDRQYTAHAQSDNAEDLSDYQSQAEIAQDPQVRRFAKDQADEVRQRSQDTNQTARGMNMPGTGEAQPAGAAIKGDGR
jgi:putative membrane protein